MLRYSSHVLIGTAATLLTLVACEGEPPKVPANPGPTATAAEPAAAPSSPPPSASPASPPPAMSEAPGRPCHCDCAAREGQATPAPPPSASAVTPEAAPVPVPATSPAPGTLASIVGTVTTTPPRAGANAVVYLEDAPVVPGPTLSAEVDNRQMNFIPFVQVVAVGGRVVFSNTDPFPHNVFSPEKGGFNLGMIQAKTTSAHVFKAPGAFPILCNLHPNMLGYIVVTPSSYFAKANAKGEFSIKDVPAGTYKITAWAPRETPQTESVTVQGASVTVNFDLHK